MAKTYTVKAGDTLSKIAETLLGDASRWTEILEANKDAIKDPNVIKAGLKLTIPTDDDDKAPAKPKHTFE
jgi:nucleoid-associated protein YgaU